MEGQVIHDVRQDSGGTRKRSPSRRRHGDRRARRATPHGIGFALEKGIPYTEGLIKNRYIGRTFIQPDQSLRELGMQLKYNPSASQSRGKTDCAGG